VAAIEITHGDGLGGSSFNYGFSRVDEIKLIAAGVQEATQAKIAVLLVPGIGTKDDLRNAREAGASVARIATHCTEADVSVQHFGIARDLGMETVGFLMMAHRTGPAELARQARIMADAGAQCVYCVDSAGALLLAGGPHGSWPEMNRDDTPAVQSEIHNSRRRPCDGAGKGNLRRRRRARRRSGRRAGAGLAAAARESRPPTCRRSPSTTSYPRACGAGPRPRCRCAPAPANGGVRSPPPVRPRRRDTCGRTRT